MVMELGSTKIVKTEECTAVIGEMDNNMDMVKELYIVVVTGEACILMDIL